MNLTQLLQTKYDDIIVSIIRGYVIINAEDIIYLNEQNYALDSNRYARSSNVNGTKYSLHREINQTPTGLDTEFANKLRYDCRRNNLSKCERFKNFRPNNNIPAYKGVHIVKKDDKEYFTSEIKRNGNVISLGLFPLTPTGLTSAVKAYNRKHRKFMQDDQDNRNNRKADIKSQN